MAHNLVEDVLYAIFLHALPSKFLLTAEGAWHEPWTIAPLNFSLVCRSWRTLVLSRPKLWREIKFDNEVNLKTKYHHLIDWSMLKKWLSRSSPSLLQIHIDIADFSGYLNEVILPIFLQESHRWHSFYLRSDTGFGLDPTGMKTVTLRSSPPLSSLSLRLHSHSQVTPFDVDLSQSVGDTCSLLEHLHVDLGVDVRLPQCRDTLRLPHLRSFHFTSVHLSLDLEELRCIFSASPNLEDIRVNVPKQTTSPLPNRDAVHLSHLSSLILTTRNRDTTKYFLDALICPSLSHLALRTGGPVANDAGEERIFLEPRRIHDFLLRRSGSGLQLEILELGWVDGWVGGWGDGDPEYAPALRDLLFSLRNLKILELRTTYLRRVVFEMLSVPPETLPNNQTSYPCPFLSELRLWHRPPNFDFVLMEEAMNEMIVSRWKAGNLRAVTLKFPYPYSAKIKERSCIAECIEEGLMVTEKWFNHK
ncbi:hypothetical protein SCHPADRAFT_162483 [Schizopora paradoxa]|uniref:Uncharacterized protein n=1 Tax=Schizopora paradoxa TaxID=27342 RepID=A0A0H2S0F8_9AGAM|nr:hypothetical protein SCHPADRAFT_162483 [Schizopora paradoxa]